MGTPQTSADRPLRRRSSAILPVLLTGILVVGAIAPAAAGPRRYAERTERRLINQDRFPRSLRMLRWDRRLAGVALRHSRRMAAKGRIFHNRKLVARVGDRRWRILAEIVGVSQNVDGLGKTVRRIHDAFNRSWPHRRVVLLRKVRRVGVGISRAEGRVYLTAVFLG